MDLSEFQQRAVIANITGLSILSTAPVDYLAQGKVHAYRKQYYGKQSRVGGGSDDGDTPTSVMPQISVSNLMF